MMIISILALLGLIVSVIALKKQQTNEAKHTCGGSGCDTVLQSRQAALFAGMPNTVLGIVWYTTVALWAVTGLLISVPSWLDTIMILGAAAALGVSLYLAGTLLFVLRQPCPLCYAAHAVNAAILLALLWSIIG